ASRCTGRPISSSADTKRFDSSLTRCGASGHISATPSTLKSVWNTARTAGTSFVGVLHVAASELTTSSGGSAIKATAPATRLNVKFAQFVRLARSFASLDAHHAGVDEPKVSAAARLASR